MKRTPRAILLIITVLLICTAFTGCDILDSLKEAHALINKNQTEITYKGYTYIPLEVSNSLFNPLTEQSINVTEEDVPVLLSQSFSIYVGQITADGSVMSLNTYYWDENYEDNFYFCREDRYEEITETLKTGPTAEVYFYSYWGFDENDEELKGDYYLTREQISAIDKIRSTVEKSSSDTDSYVVDASVYVCAATKDMVFRWHELFIYMKDGVYFIEETVEPSFSYTVPKEYNEIFDEIMAMELSLA